MRIYDDYKMYRDGSIKLLTENMENKDRDGNFRIYNVPAKILETRIGDSGAVSVSFTDAKGNPDIEDVALMVATEFVPNEDPTRYTKLRFRDLNRGNAKASNLYWDGVGVYMRK